MLLAVGYGRFVGLLQEGRPGQAVLWDTRTGKRMAGVTGKADGVCSVAFSPDGKILAVAEYPGIIRLCDAPTGRVGLTIQAPALTTGSIAFSPDGKWLAAGLWAGGKDGVSSPGNDIAVWDTATGELTRTLQGHAEGVLAVAFSPDGKLLASGGWEGVVKVWDVASGRERATLDFPALRKRLGAANPICVESVTFSPDGRTLVTCVGVSMIREKPAGAGEVTFWSTTNDRVVATLQGIDEMVRRVAFSPDGKLLATAGSSGSIRLWDTATYRAAGEMKGWLPIAFSPDGRELVSSVDEQTIAPRKVAEAIRR
jgi:WD40 repeat protein